MNQSPCSLPNLPPDHAVILKEFIYSSIGRLREKRRKTNRQLTNPRVQLKTCWILFYIVVVACKLVASIECSRTEQSKIELRRNFLCRFQVAERERPRNKNNITSCCVTAELVRVSDVTLFCSMKIDVCAIEEGKIERKRERCQKIGLEVTFVSKQSKKRNLI